MMIVGVIEIVAGVLVAINPRFGGYLVSGWLIGIIVDLVLVGGYLDVALRDLGLSLGAPGPGTFGRGRGSSGSGRARMNLVAAAAAATRPFTRDPEELAKATTELELASNERRIQ
jgi:hypothetical protein